MSIEKQKSLRTNMILNAVRGAMQVLFPLITFPYVSRILGAESLGQYNFSNSVVSYFTLLAGLGISRYAIRDGAAIREDPLRLNCFANELFTINIISTVFAYAMLAISLAVSSTLKNYLLLLGILSLQVILTTIGMEWIYSIYEDYLYITVRSILFQFVSLILLFCCVHTRNDVAVYAVITVLACAGSNLLNYYHARKRIRVRLTRHINWKRHLRPIFILFAMSLTVSIYVSSDVTVLGILCGDKTVGIYSAATKIYSVVKQILGTVLVVSIPRLSAFYGTGRMDKFRLTASKIYKTMVTLMLPTMTGIMILSEPIILLISGQEYIEAASSLRILSIALMFCMTAWFWGQCILVPMKHEEEVFRVTVVSAVLNLTLNILLIPFWQEKAAAFTTALAEGCTYVWSMIRGRKYSGISGIGSTYLKSIIGCVGILAVNTAVKYFAMSNMLYIMVTIALSIIVYGAIEILVKNEEVWRLTCEIKYKLHVQEANAPKKEGL